MDITGKECLLKASEILAIGFTPSLFYNAFDKDGNGLVLANDPLAISWNVHGSICKVNGIWFDVSAYDILVKFLMPHGVIKPVKGIRTENIDEWAVRTNKTQNELVTLIKDCGNATK